MPKDPRDFSSQTIQQSYPNGGFTQLGSAVNGAVVNGVRISDEFNYGVSEEIVVLDPEVDPVWARFRNNRTDRSYFDYYYTGSDIQVYIAGIEDEKLPMEALAFNVEQKKTPVYGAFSTTYDAVMRGTRIITGSFKITSSTTDFMIRKVAQAAQAKQDSGTLFPSISEPYSDWADKALVDRYWNINLEKTRSAFWDRKHLFSSHPPFSLVIVYGIQSTSLVPQNGKCSLKDLAYLDDENNRALYLDINDRLVDADPSGSERIVLDSVELTSCQMEYAPTGEPLGEVYTFFAKDYYTPF